MSIIDTVKDVKSLFVRSKTWYKSPEWYTHIDKIIETIKTYDAYNDVNAGEKANTTTNNLNDHLQLCCLKNSHDIILAGYRFANDFLEGKVYDSPQIKFNDDWHIVNWKKYKGVIIFIHGLQSHSLFSLLNLSYLNNEYSMCTNFTKAQEKKMLNLARNAAQTYSYENSWAAALNAAGYVVYAIDLSGHGLSDGYKGNRCYFHSVESLVDDVLLFIKCLQDTNELDKSIPISIMGTSLGGLIAVNTVSKGVKNKLFEPMNNNNGNNYKCSSTILCAPALGLHTSKLDFSGKVLNMLRGILLYIVPAYPIYSFKPTMQYSFITIMMMRDPLFHKQKLTLHVLDSIMRAVDRVDPTGYPENIPLLICHTSLDTYVDYTKSVSFIKSTNAKVKKLHDKHNLVHIYSKEPGFLALVNSIIEWNNSIQEVKNENT